MDLSVKEAARLLNTSENVLYRMIRDGTIPSRRIGDHHRLNRVELLEWATARNMKVSPELFRDEEAPPSPELILADALAAGGFIYDVEGGDKPAVLRSLCSRLSLPQGVSADDLFAVLMARETLGSTAIGNGIAIPHPRSPLILHVSRPLVNAAFLRQPVDFSALDGRPVTVLFTIISTTIRFHLSLLSHLMHALQDHAVQRLLRERGGGEAILTEVRRIESALAKSGGRS